MRQAISTVHLVDDDERILVALTRLLSLAGHRVEAHCCAEEFLDRQDPDMPGCAVVDLGLPGLDGFGLQQILEDTDTERPIIFLTGQGDIPTCVQAMRAGAVDFLTKPIEAARLLSSVAIALERDQQIRSASRERCDVEHRLALLTRREREVFRCVVSGKLNKQIAAELGTVEKTIKVHRGRMMDKMHVRSVADLVRLAAVIGA
jgi:FixJ family two-component response regulator